MIGQVKSNIMSRSGRPNDNNLLSNVFLRSRVFEGVDDLSLEFFLEEMANQPRVLGHEETQKKWTCLGNLGILHDPAPSPRAKTRWVGRRTRLVSVPSGNIRIKLTIHAPEASFSADTTVEEVQTLSSMTLAYDSNQSANFHGELRNGL